LILDVDIRSSAVISSWSDARHLVTDFPTSLQTR
jgi:hypothetical protein